MLHQHYDEENVLEDLDFDDIEFENVPKESLVPDDYQVNAIEDNDDFDDSNMITDKINDNFDVSSHGGSDVNLPHGSTTSVGRNMTSSVASLSDHTKDKHDRSKDDNKSIVKGKDSNVSKAKGNLKVKSNAKNLENNGGNSQYHLGFKCFLILQSVVYLLYFNN